MKSMSGLVEFKCKGGEFAYSDEERTLSYVTPEGRKENVIAPEGFTMSFCVDKDCGTAYWLVLAGEHK